MFSLVGFFFVFFFFLPPVSILSNGTEIVAQTSTSVTNQDPTELFILLIFLTFTARNFYNEHGVCLFVVYSDSNEVEIFR